MAEALDPVQPLLTLLQLTRRAREADTPEMLGFVAVNESLQLLPYRQAVLWRQDAMLGVGAVAALSGLPQVNPAAPYAQWLTQACPTLAKCALDMKPIAVSATDLPERLASQWADWLPAYGLWLPLPNTGAGLLLAAETPWLAHHLALAGELAHAYGHALAAFSTHKGWGTRWRSFWQGAWRRWWLALLVCTVAFFPVEQSVLAPAEVGPKNPRLVRTPQEGVVEQVAVQPNQAVKAGSLLASLDPITLQARESLARKALEEAQEQYRQAAQMAVTDDKTRLELMQRKAAVEERGVELQYSSEQLGRVQLRAERDGVAVFDDVTALQGRAVTAGERIMVLADPKQVELLVHLPSTERFAVQIGHAVSFYPNANPLSHYSARITQVAYAPEPGRDGVLAYLLKAEFPAEVTPRIGLMGSARITGEKSPLIWFALRRPLTLLRQWLGW